MIDERNGGVIVVRYGGVIDERHCGVIDVRHGGVIDVRHNGVTDVRCGSVRIPKLVRCGESLDRSAEGNLKMPVEALIYQFRLYRSSTQVRSVHSPHTPQHNHNT